jgi:hypothetical protein
MDVNQKRIRVYRTTTYCTAKDKNGFQWVRSAHTGDFQEKGSINKEICLISPICPAR